jgi:hypothetical protein
VAIYDLSGSSTGSGIVPPVTPIKVAVVVGLMLGSAISVGAVSRRLIIGGQAYGFGDLGDHLLIVTAGTAVGQGDATGDIVRVMPLQGRAIGGSNLYESVPEPIIGCAYVNATYVVDRVPCPVICPGAVRQSFRWAHTFVAGDLMLAIRDVAGNPFAPIMVLYRMYQVLPGGGLLPVGDPNRRPAKCGKRLGVYYATGTAGECGQPGDWLIEWRWQRSTFAPPQVERYPFRVLDAVLDTSVTDPTCRTAKYGWDD